MNGPGGSLHLTVRGGGGGDNNNQKPSSSSLGLSSRVFSFFSTSVFVVVFVVIVLAIVVFSSSHVRLAPRTHDDAHALEIRKFAIQAKESRDMYEKIKQTLLDKEKVIRDLEAQVAIAREERDLFKDSSRAKDDLIRSRHVHKLANPRLGRPDSYEFQKRGRYVGEETRAGSIEMSAAGLDRHEVTGENSGRSALRNIPKSYRGDRSGRRRLRR